MTDDKRPDKSTPPSDGPRKSRGRKSPRDQDDSHPALPPSLKGEAAESLRRAILSLREKERQRLSDSGEVDEDDPQADPDPSQPAPVLAESQHDSDHERDHHTEDDLERAWAEATPDAGESWAEGAWNAPETPSDAPAEAAEAAKAKAEEEPPAPKADTSAPAASSFAEQDDSHDVPPGSSEIVPVEQRRVRRVLDSRALSQEEREAGAVERHIDPPWTLQQFFNGEIDLDIELTKRFPNMPMMSLIKFRSLGTRPGRQVATLSTQDGSASVIVDADKSSGVIQLSFTFGSMITLRFTLADLSEMDRARWLDLMQREQGGLSFLWGPSRWAKDYLICISRKYFINLYAFSPNNFDAAVRMTPTVTEKLLAWLAEIWSDDDPPPDEETNLLTW